jgi:hypothetical protein
MLEISNPTIEGTFQGAKWWKVQALVSGEELQSLFSRLEPFWIYLLGAIGEGKALEKEFFLEELGRWMSGLQRGEVPSSACLRKILAAGFVDSEKALYLHEVGTGRYLVKVREPVLQVQAHFFVESEGKFFSGVFGPDAVFWGLQFSFPQVMQDGKTGEVVRVEENRMLKVVRQWIRDVTLPTRFRVRGVEVVTPIRTGRSVLPWIGVHPGLKQGGIDVCH